MFSNKFSYYQSLDTMVIIYLLDLLSADGKQEHETDGHCTFVVLMNTELQRKRVH